MLMLSLPYWKSVLTSPSSTLTYCKENIFENSFNGEFWSKVCQNTAINWEDIPAALLMIQSVEK